MVAVVVPSPAWSEVLEATSRTICAPMFSNLFSSSISLATVTPSLVTRGAPNDLSSTTLRPLGPRVTRTASARISIPCSIFSRASTENFTSLALMFVAPERSLGSPIGETTRSDRWIRIECPFQGIRVDATGGGSGRFLLGDRLFEHSHDVALFHDEIFDPVELDLGAGPFPEQHAVTDLEVDRDELTGLVAASRAHGDDLALLRFLL